MLRKLTQSLGFVLCVTLAGCAPEPQGDGPTAAKEVSKRTILFPNYPQAGRTYLSFSSAHGFQVNYLGQGGASKLWYPGNRIVLDENYKRDVISGTQVLCWRHGEDTYNPVIKTRGGNFACMPLDLSRKTIVAELVGDPFKLTTGALPYRLKRCAAPAEFTFDRIRFGC